MISNGNIMSSSRAFSCLPSVKKQKHDFHCFFVVQCVIKQLLDSVLVISRIIKVRLWLITPTSTLIILDITKTLSDNCSSTAPTNYLKKRFFPAGALSCGSAFLMNSDLQLLSANLKVNCVITALNETRHP